MQTILPPNAASCGHQVRSYAAIQCNGMLRKLSSTTGACGAAAAVRRGRCPARAQGSKVRFADDPGIERKTGKCWGARRLMGYCGAVPSEDSSGQRTRRGSITKTGNAHLRRIVVKATWSYHRPPCIWYGLRANCSGRDDHRIGAIPQEKSGQPLLPRQVAPVPLGIHRQKGG